jgi:hypothetical protein
VDAAIFYSILILSRLDNSPLKSLWTFVPAWPIQFVSGAKPGVKRKINQIKSEIETKEKRKKYEQDKRPARTFNIKWQVVGTGWCSMPTTMT